MVKANYVRSGAGRGATMRASAQYYGHRPDQEGDRTYRPAFDDMGDGLTKEQVYGYVEGKGEEYAYRLVLSPGEDLTEGELKEWTRDVMYEVGMNYGDWVAFVHDDHTEHPHAHVIAHTDEKLTVEDFEVMREDGDRSAQEILEIKAEMQQDPMEERSTQAEQQQGPAAGSAPDETDDQHPGKKEKVEESQSQGV